MNFLAAAIDRGKLSPFPRAFANTEWNSPNLLYVLVRHEWGRESNDARKNCVLAGIVFQVPTNRQESAES